MSVAFLFGTRGSRRNSFGERISASDKPENLDLREEALADARRAWLPARDEGCPFFSVARSTVYRKEILIQKAESFPHGGNVWANERFLRASDMVR